MGKDVTTRRKKKAGRMKDLSAKPKRAGTVKGRLRAGGGLFEPPIDPGAFSRS